MHLPTLKVPIVLNLKKNLLGRLKQMMVLASSTLDVLSARSKTWPSLPKFQPSFLDIVESYIP
jgi:hypothetical protein